MQKLKKCQKTQNLNKICIIFLSGIKALDQDPESRIHIKIKPWFWIQIRIHAYADSKHL